MGAAEWAGFVAVLREEAADALVVQKRVHRVPGRHDLRLSVRRACAEAEKRRQEQA